MDFKLENCILRKNLQESSTGEKSERRNFLAEMILSRKNNKGTGIVKTEDGH